MEIIVFRDGEIAQWFRAFAAQSSRLELRSQNALRCPIHTYGPRHQWQEEKGGLRELAGLQPSSGNMKSKFRERYCLKEITECGRGHWVPSPGFPMHVVCMSAHV